MTNSVNRRALGGLLNLLVCMALLVFLPAWTVRYWQAEVFFCVFFGSTLAITLYLMTKDPGLLERRIRAGSIAENETSQKVIQGLAGAAFMAMVVLSALDHRLGWSSVSPYAVFAGDSLVAIGFIIVFRVFRENSYTSGTIEVAAEQKVVSTGPYALVRHPMYGGALILLAGMPVALGSWWGLLAIIPMTIVIVWRLVAEERFLDKNLRGYPEYRGRVKYRLAPLIW